MKTVLERIESRISDVIAEVTGQMGFPALVKSATDPKFGDYQVNGVMAIAKQLKTNPRKLAEQIVAKLDISDICETPEIAGPGFINLRLKPELVAAREVFDLHLLGSNDVDGVGGLDRNARGARGSNDHGFQLYVGAVANGFGKGLD